jgi:hypothetical protein
MMPVEKHKVINVVESHGTQFFVDLCKAMYTECSIPYKEQNSFLVCYDLVKKNPEQLLMVELPHNHIIRNEEDDAQKVTATTPVKQVASGLNTSLLKPKDLVGGGGVVQAHVVQQRLHDVKLNNHAPRMYLDVQCSDEQVREFGPGAKDLRKCSIMSYARGTGATRKLANRKFDNLGYVK